MTTSSSHAAALVNDGDQLDASRVFCARVTRSRARNFYYGMMLTPRRQRSSMYAVYAWMRAVDDLADGPVGDGDAGGEAEADARRRGLESFRRRTHAVLHDQPGALDAEPGPIAPMWPAVARTLREHHIPVKYLDAMIDGQLKDLHQTRYDTFDSLYDYCYQVASVVGLICLEVWGYEGGEATRKLAEERGVALQLTNILRDLVEDAARDRVYLPLEDLARFGFDADSFKRRVLAAAGAADGDDAAAGDFDGLMAFELHRARGYYERTESLESFITPSCRPTCWAMMKIYETLLRRIEHCPRAVLRKNVRLGKVQKLFIAARATCRRGLRK